MVFFTGMCQVDFTLRNAKLPDEKYEGMPCKEALDFLRHLDPCQSSEIRDCPHFISKMSLKDRDVSYTVPSECTALKAAGLIAIYMQLGLKHLPRILSDDDSPVVSG